MKLLFLDAYFYPENIAFTHIELDIMEGLQAAGHSITVVCPTPCRGIPEETIKRYHNRIHEVYRGIRVHRYQAPREGKNPLLRAFRYFWCNLRGSMIAKHYRDTDAVFAVSTPPTQGYFAGKLAKKLNVPLIYSLQDLFPDSLVTTGITTESSPLYRIGARLERKTYPLCSKIIVLSRTAERQLLERGVPEDCLTAVSNWIDTEAVKPVPREENRLFDEFNVDRDRFTVVYAGNFGASQGADVILKAAEMMKDNKEISFVIFGGGTEFDKAVKLAEELNLDNVAINPLLPPDRVPEVYSMGDVALITCKKGVGKTAMPSKLWSIMACDTPVIAAFDTDSELADVLRESGAGVCVEPEDPAALKEAIEEAYANRASASAAAAREYLMRHASKEACVRQYVDCFEQAAGSEKAR